MPTWDLALDVVKRDAPLGLVTGWAAVTTEPDGRQVIDGHGEIYPIDELEKAAHAAIPYAAGGVGDMHERRGVADLVESFVVTREKREALGFGEGPEGWVVTLRVHDPRLREQIAKGEKAELSLRGSARFRTRADGVKVARDIQLDRVELLSIVDAGASGSQDYPPRVVLMKRDSGIGRIKKTLARIFQKQQEPTMTIEEILAEMPEDKRNVILAALEEAKKAGAAQPPTESTEKKGDDEEEEKKKGDDAEAFAKRELSEDVRKRLDEADVLTKRVAQLEGAEMDRKFFAKAKKLDHLPDMTTEQIAKLLKSAHAHLPPKEYAEIEKSLASAASAVRKSGMLEEIGTTQSSEDSAQGRIENIAKRLVEKDPTMDMSTARLAACKTNPDIYAEYRAEQRGE